MTVEFEPQDQRRLIQELGFGWTITKFPDERSPYFVAKREHYRGTSFSSYLKFESLYRNVSIRAENERRRTERTERTERTRNTPRPQPAAVASTTGQGDTTP